jgi:hypothetical protein
MIPASRSSSRLAKSQADLNNSRIPADLRPFSPTTYNGASRPENVYRFRSIVLLDDNGNDGSIATLIPRWTGSLSRRPVWATSGISPRSFPGRIQAHALAVGNGTT